MENEKENVVTVPSIPEESRESPIPDKIQQVLEKLQQRLNEKDVQLLELQKRMEVLQTSGHSLASAGKNHVRSATARSHRNGTSNATTSGAKHPGVKSGHASGASVGGTKCKSRSVPSSPSKRTNSTSQKGPTSSRPPSRQAHLASEQSSPMVAFGTRTGAARSLQDRNRTKYRTFGGGSFKSADTKGTSRGGRKMPSGRPSAVDSKRGDALLSQLPKNRNLGGSGKSGDSGSCCSTDSRGSSSADFVSVNGSPSPGFSADDGSGSGGNHHGGLLSEEALSYCELAARLKRMTEEHERLQAEHSRVLASLAEKRAIDEKSARLGEMSEMTDFSVSEGSMMISERNHSEMIESSSENTLASTDSEQIFSEPKPPTDSVREFCKKEVLRLREDTMNLRKRISMTEKKLEESSNHVKELLDDKLNLEATIAIKDVQIKELEDRISALQTDSDLKNVRNLELHQEIQTMKQQHAEVLRQHELELKRQISENALAIKDVEKDAAETKEFLQAEHSALSEELAEVQAKLKEKEKQMKQLQQLLLDHKIPLDTSIDDHQRLDASDLQGDAKLTAVLAKMSLTLNSNFSCCLCALNKLTENIKKVISLVTDEVAPTMGVTLQVEAEESHSLPDTTTSNSFTEEQLQMAISHSPLLAHPSLVQSVLAAIASAAESGTESEDSSTLTFNTTINRSSPFTPPGEEANYASSVNQANHLLSDASETSVEIYNDPQLDNDLLDPSVADKLPSDASCNDDIPLMQMICSICEDNSRIISEMNKITLDADNAVIRLRACLKIVHEDIQLQGNKTKEQREKLEKECKMAEERCKNLQEELKHMQVAENRMREELSAAIQKQKQIDIALQKNRHQSVEFSEKLDNDPDLDNHTSSVREQLHQALLGKKLLETEKLILAEQVEEMTAKIQDLTENNHIGSNGASLAESLKEKISLKNEVQKLKLQVLEREREVANLKTKNVRHQEIVLSNWKTAQTEVKQFDELFNQVLETLRNIPDVVASCDQLRKLWVELEDEEMKAKS